MPGSTASMADKVRPQSHLLACDAGPATAAPSSSKHSVHAHPCLFVRKRVVGICMKKTGDTYVAKGSQMRPVDVCTVGMCGSCYWCAFGLSSWAHVICHCGCARLSCPAKLGRRPPLCRPRLEFWWQTHLSVPKGVKHVGVCLWEVARPGAENRVLDLSQVHTVGQQRLKRPLGVVQVHEEHHLGRHDVMRNGCPRNGRNAPQVRPQRSRDPCKAGRSRPRAGASGTQPATFLSAYVVLYPSRSGESM